MVRAARRLRPVRALIMSAAKAAVVLLTALPLAAGSHATENRAYWIAGGSGLNDDEWTSTNGWQGGRDPRIADEVHLCKSVTVQTTQVLHGTALVVGSCPTASVRSARQEPPASDVRGRTGSTRRRHQSAA